jgi:hypothetical protein
MKTYELFIVHLEYAYNLLNTYWKIFQINECEKLKTYSVPLHTRIFR